jgi:hypothetical protein
VREDFVHEFSSAIQDAVKIRQVGLVSISNYLTDRRGELGFLLGESEGRFFCWSELSIFRYENLKVEVALHLQA